MVQKSQNTNNAELPIPLDISDEVCMQYMQQAEVLMLHCNIDHRNISRVYSFRQVDQIWKEQCMLCRLNVESKQKLVQCRNCKQVFHANHIFTYLRYHNGRSKDEARCPVCEAILNRHFVPFTIMVQS